MKYIRIYLLLGLFFVIPESQSAPMTLNFDGVVNSFFSDPIDPFNGSIDVGTLMSASVVFDTTTPNSIVSASTGSYSMSQPFGMVMDIGGNILTATDMFNIGIMHSAGTDDQITVLAQQGVQGG